MGMLADLRKFIFSEDVKDGAAVSQGTWNKIGGMLNFLGHRVHQEKQFFLNGPYSGWLSPHDFADGLAVFEFDAEIFNVWVFNIVPGATGVTELDIKIKPKSGGAFTSIFSTTPKILPTAAANTWFEIGDTATGITAPVLTSAPLLVNRGDAIKLDIITAMDTAQTAGILIHYRPR